MSVSLCPVWSSGRLMTKNSKMMQYCFSRQEFKKEIDASGLLLSLIVSCHYEHCLTFLLCQWHSAPSLLVATGDVTLLKTAPKTAGNGSF